MKTPTFNDIIEEMNNLIKCDNISINLDGDDECLFMLSTNIFRDSFNNMYKHHVYYHGNKLVNIKFINPKETQEIITSYIKDNDIEDKIKQYIFKWLIRFKSNLCDKKKLSSLSNIIQQDLSTVLVSSESLSRTKLDNVQRKHCKDITLHSIQVTKTINDLIDHYKLSSGFLLYIPKIFNIHDFIKNINNSTRMNLNNVNIFFNSDDSIPEYIFADSDKIEQCILSILRLSEKYLIKNKYVDITIKGKNTENKNILVFIIKQYWSDKKIIGSNGIIKSSLDYYEHIYFFTCKKLLNIVKGDMYIKSNDDTINIEFTFPVNTIDDLNIKLKECIKSDLIPKNVLCIDNNIKNRLKMSSILTTLNLLPIQCMTVEEAVQTLHIQQSFIFIIINISENEINTNKISKLMNIIYKNKYPIIFIYDIRKKIDTNIYTGTDFYTVVNPISKTSLYNVIYKIFRKLS